MRRFKLKWAGGAVAAEGVEFADGTVAVRRVSGVSSTAVYLTVEVVTEDYSTATVEWIDRADVVIGYVATKDGPALRCLTHPFLVRPHRDLMESELKGEERFLCDICRRQLEEVYLERREHVDKAPLPVKILREEDSLNSLVIGYRATRSPEFAPLLRCLSDPFVVTVAKRITRTDLPDGGTCSRCGVDLLAFLDDPTRLCTLDRWEQARTAEPPEYREHAAGCSKLYYHPDTCWPVEG